MFDPQKPHICGSGTTLIKNTILPFLSSRPILLKVFKTLRGVGEAPDAKFTSDFWCLTIEHAMYIRNRVSICHAADAFGGKGKRVCSTETD